MSRDINVFFSGVLNKGAYFKNNNHKLLTDKSITIWSVSYHPYNQ